MAEDQDQRSDLELALSAWRQGDFALVDYGFLAAVESDGGEPFEPGLQGDVVGLAVASQTCDIVRLQEDRSFVIACPLIRRSEQVDQDVAAGKKPNLFRIEGAEEGVFADISRMMSVEKKLLASWERCDGFTTDTKRAEFGAALERKFGRFAFPDKFDFAVSKFRRRVDKRHKQDASPVGKIYRSLEQIRFAANPSWEDRPTSITLVAILNPDDEREAEIAEIRQELISEITKIVLPEGMSWSEERLWLGTTADLTAKVYLLSQRADFDYLCD